MPVIMKKIFLNIFILFYILSSPAYSQTTFDPIDPACSSPTTDPIDPACAYTQDPVDPACSSPTMDPVDPACAYTQDPADPACSGPTMDPVDPACAYTQDPADPACDSPPYTEDPVDPDCYTSDPVLPDCMSYTDDPADPGCGTPYTEDPVFPDCYCPAGFYWCPDISDCVPDGTPCPPVTYTEDPDDPDCYTADPALPACQTYTQDPGDPDCYTADPALPECMYYTQDYADPDCYTADPALPACQTYTQDPGDPDCYTADPALPACQTYTQDPGDPDCYTADPALPVCQTYTQDPGDPDCYTADPALPVCQTYTQDSADPDCYTFDPALPVCQTYTQDPGDPDCYTADPALPVCQTYTQDPSDPDCYTADPALPECMYYTQDSADPDCYTADPALPACRTYTQDPINPDCYTMNPELPECQSPTMNPERPECYTTDPELPECQNFTQDPERPECFTVDPQLPECQNFTMDPERPECFTLDPQLSDCRNLTMDPERPECFTIDPQLPECRNFTQDPAQPECFTTDPQLPECQDFTQDPAQPECLTMDPQLPECQDFTQDPAQPECFTMDPQLPVCRNFTADPANPVCFTMDPEMPECRNITMDPELPECFTMDPQKTECQNFTQDPNSPECLTSDPQQPECQNFTLDPLQPECYTFDPECIQPTLDPDDNECSLQSDITAEFLAFPASGFPPLEVQFVNLSRGFIDMFSWNFGDEGTSFDINPSHIFTSPGTYTPTLTITVPMDIYTPMLTRIDPGGSYTATGSPITVFSSELLADFTADKNRGNAPLTVQFTDVSQGDVTGYMWDFGDGGSTDPSPSHTFNDPGMYTVSLTVFDEDGENTKVKPAYITVLQDAPSAEFSASPTQGSVPLAVAFTNQSAGNITNHLWNFGDGNTSNEISPSHTYSSQGVYPVTLLVEGPTGMDIETKADYITVNPGAVQLFSISGTVTGIDLQGIVINLTGDQSMSAPVDSSGTYAFSGLAPGTYTVTPFRRGALFSPTSSQQTVIFQDINNVDFSLRRQNPTVASVFVTPSQVPADATTPVAFIANVVHPGGEDQISSVTIDLSDIGGGIQQMNESSGVYTLQATVDNDTAPGWKVLPVTVVDTSSLSDTSSVTLEVTGKVSDTASGLSSNIHQLNNTIGGQDFIIEFSRSGGSDNSTARIHKESDGDSYDDLLLQVFKPDGTAYFSEEIPITEDTSEIVIENAEEGTWTYQVTNNRSVPQNYSINTTTSGTSVITGMIIDSESGDGIDGALVSTDAGGSTKADEGYYVLLHPSGVLSLRASASGFSSMAKSVSLGTGSSQVVDLFLDKGDNNTSQCALSHVLTASQQGYLNVMRMFRDAVLTKTAQGKKCIELYYRHSPEISTLLQNDPDLQSSIRSSLIDIFKMFAGILTGKPVQIDMGGICGIKPCIDEIKSKASSELKKDIEYMFNP